MPRQYGFDYIVVGAGSAGCILANRLSRNYRVLLLEAGGRDWNPMIRVPLMTRLLYEMPSLNWGYDTEPQLELGGRTVHWPRGKVLGGSSSINGMAYVRGHFSDYDGWAARGLKGWSYDEVLPYFRRLEDHQDKTSDFRGKGGPLRLTTPATTGPLPDAFFEACDQAGVPKNDDFNGKDQEGYGRHDFAIYRGRRQNTATAYLRQAQKRKSLTIWTRTHVTRINLRSGRATGVTCVRDGGQEEHVAVEGEVLLAGGAINSPHLMMLSGIGAADHLRQAGISPVHDLPGVGKNLHDHVGVYGIFDASNAQITFNRFLRPDRALAAIGLAWAFGVGPAAMMPTQASAFVRSNADLDRPDIQLSLMPILPTKRLLQWGAWRDDAFVIHAYQLRPGSRGAISLRSNAPTAKPLIDPGYLTDSEDLNALRNCLGIIRNIAQQDAMRPWISRERSPGPATVNRPAMDAWIRDSASTCFHPVGTCAMGTEPSAGAVTDANLRVHGIDGLRVADASVIPAITGGNTAAPVMMIAEKAAQAILAP